MRRGRVPVPGAPPQTPLFVESLNSPPELERCRPSSSTAPPAIRSGVCAGEVSLLLRARRRNSSRCISTRDPYKGRTLSSTSTTSPSNRSPAMRSISAASRTRRAWNSASSRVRLYQSGSLAADSVNTHSSTLQRTRTVMALAAHSSPRERAMGTYPAICNPGSTVALCRASAFRRKRFEWRRQGRSRGHPDTDTLASRSADRPAIDRNRCGLSRDTLAPVRDRAGLRTVPPFLANCGRQPSRLGTPSRCCSGSHFCRDGQFHLHGVPLRRGTAPALLAAFRGLPGAY